MLTRYGHFTVYKIMEKCIMAHRCKCHYCRFFEQNCDSVIETTYSEDKHKNTVKGK